MSHASPKQPQTGWLIPIKIPALFFGVVFTLELDMYIPKVKTKIYCFNLEQYFLIECCKYHHNLAGTFTYMANIEF